MKEADLKSIRKAKIQQEMQDMEASLQRAKLDATMADGISWGMQEDAIEENEVCRTFYCMFIIHDFMNKWHYDLQCALLQDYEILFCACAS